LRPHKSGSVFLILAVGYPAAGTVVPRNPKKALPDIARFV
jgi:hypothetical protein